MARVTKAELEETIRALKQKLAEATNSSPPTGLLSVAYLLSDGVPRAVTISHLKTASELRAVKVALTNVTMTVDRMLLEAVEREAKAERPPVQPTDVS